MMVRDGDYVAIFNSVHRVMQAEKLLKGQGYAILLIPVPRSLRADCGLAIRYAADDRQAVEEALGSAHLLPEETYCKTGDRYLPPDSPLR
jgi:hypothetical protein